MEVQTDLIYVLLFPLMKYEFVHTILLGFFFFKRDQTSADTEWNFSQAAQIRSNTISS